MHVTKSELRKCFFSGSRTHGPFGEREMFSSGQELPPLLGGGATDKSEPCWTCLFELVPFDCSFEGDLIGKPQCCEISSKEIAPIWVFFFEKGSWANPRPDRHIKHTVSPALRFPCYHPPSNGDTSQEAEHGGCLKRMR